MKKESWNSELTKLSLVCCTTLALSVAAAHAQPTRAEGRASVAGKVARTDEEHSSGIKVHGHWMIEVRTAEGKLRSRNQFENLFVGRQAITAVLGMQNAVGFWIVSVQSKTVGGACVVPNQNQAGPCEITEPGFDAASAGRYSSAATLKVTVPDLAVDGNTFTLAGNVTVEAGSIIEQVQTLISLCPPLGAQKPPEPCNAGTQVVFTQAGKGSGLPAGGIQVQTGDNVQITVDISFTG